MTTKSGLAAIGCCAACCVLALAGCASTDTGAQLQASLRKVTPSFMLSEHDRAERNLKDPKSLNLAYGHFQESIGQTAEARKSYELALRDDPKSVEAILGMARLDQLADKPKDAEAGFKKALRMKPDDAAVLAACGQFYASQKRWSEAFDSLNAAVAAAPKEAVYKHYLAMAKTRSGDVKGGLALFTQLVGSDMAHYNVAYLLKQDGKKEAAIQQCQFALEANPKFEPARTLLEQIEAPQVAGAPAARHRSYQPPAADAVSPSRANSGLFSRGPSSLTQTSMSWTPRGANGPYTLKNPNAGSSGGSSAAGEDPWGSPFKDVSQ